MGAYVQFESFDMEFDLSKISFCHMSLKFPEGWLSVTAITAKATIATLIAKHRNTRH